MVVGVSGTENENISSKMNGNGHDQHTNIDDKEEINTEPKSPKSLTRQDSLKLAESFFQALQCNDKEKLKLIYEEKQNIEDFLRAKGLHALNTIIPTGDRELVTLLLDFGFDVNLTDQGSGKTGLHTCHHPEIVELLCERGANPNIPDFKGRVPLHDYIVRANVLKISFYDNNASYELQVECIKIILDYGAKISIVDHSFRQSCIHYAASLGDYQMLSILLSKSKARYQIDQPDLNGNTAILLAASCDSADGEVLQCLMLLLDKGASVAACNDIGESPLHMICCNQYLCSNDLAESVIEMLLHLNDAVDNKLTVDVNCRDNDGCTPCMLACAARNWDLCQVLLSAGADMNVPCSMNSSFLQLGNSSSVGRSRTNSQQSSSSPTPPHSSNPHCGSNTAKYTETSEEESLRDILISPTTTKIMAISDCTASDLMPKGPRNRLFAHISRKQTIILSDSRDRCMNCASTFDGGDGPTNSNFTNGMNSVLFSLALKSGKHHCRLCGRVICGECSPHMLHRNKMPTFVFDNEEYADENYLRVCLICYNVIVGPLV